MKLKHILSFLGSLFFIGNGQAQEVKKETQPQQNGGTVPINNNDPSIKIGVKTQPEVSSKYLPGKGNEVNNKTHVAVPNKGDITTPNKGNVALPDKANVVMPGKGDIQMQNKSAQALLSGSPLYEESFHQTEPGDLPSGWRSNGTGEVVHAPGAGGKWLQLDEETNYTTSLDMDLPASFKVEFDFLANYKDDQAVPELSLRVFRQGEAYREPGIVLSVAPNGGTATETTRAQVASFEVGGGEKFRSPAKTQTFFQDKNGKNQAVHITLLVSNGRVTAWLDYQKMIDVTGAVPENVVFNRVGFETGSYGGGRNNYKYYISNIRVTAE